MNIKISSSSLAHAKRIPPSNLKGARNTESFEQFLKETSLQLEAPKPFALPGTESKV